MSDYHYQTLFVTMIAGLFLAFRWRQTVDALAKAINKFRGGGPPSPMHPLPSGDALLLRKRLLRKYEAIRASRK